MVLVITVLAITEVAANQPESSDSIYRITLADINNNTGSSQISIIALESNHFQLASMNANPLWNNGSFVNIHRAGNTSNLQLLGNITQFHSQHLSNYQRVCNNNCTTSTCASFREILTQGFLQDSFLQTKPFNAAFIDEVLQNVYFCFARRHDNQQLFTGFYTSAPNSQSSKIWVNPSRNSLCFAHTVIHELGHALGLGETLSDLKAELFIGQTSSNRHNSDLAYNATFDRMLLSSVGADKFWTAAYYSNAAYGQLWDEVFGDIITHKELEIVRGVAFAGLVDNNVNNTFSASANLTLNQASALIHQYFVSLNDNTLSDTQRKENLNHLRSWIDFYVSFAIQNSLSMSPSVHDWIIANHNTRFSS